MAEACIPRADNVTAQCTQLDNLTGSVEDAADFDANRPKWRARHDSNV